MLLRLEIGVEDIDMLTHIERRFFYLFYIIHVTWMLNSFGFQEKQIIAVMLVFGIACILSLLNVATIVLLGAKLSD